MHEIKIIKGNMDDLEDLHQLWIQLIEYHHDIGNIGGFIYKSDRYDDLRKHLEKEIQHNKFCVMVAKLDGQSIGFAKANILSYPTFFEDNVFCMIGQIFVQEEFRGKGIGSRLINTIEEWAKEKDINQVRLGLNYKNKRSFSFYEKLDYKPTSITLKKRLK